MEKLNLIVNDLRLPDQLKEYFSSSEAIAPFLTTEIINEIEELYVYYSSLYTFDSTEFSAFTIRTLKDSESSGSSLCPLQKILEENLNLNSRDKGFSKKNRSDIKDNPLISRKFKEIGMDFIEFTEKNYHKEKISAKEFYKYVGKLELINDLIRDVFYGKLLHDAQFIISRSNKTIE